MVSRRTKIGLIHSYSYDSEIAEAYLCNHSELKPSHASEPPTDEPGNKPYLLCTHNLVKGCGGTDRFNLFKEKERSLLIWDESLLQSESRGIQWYKLKSSIGWLEPQPQFKNHPESDDAIRYVKSAIQTIEEDMKCQRDFGAEPEIINLPKLTMDKIRRYEDLFTNNEKYSSINELLEISQNELRVVDTGMQSGGFVQYEIRVPKELQNIIILDASHIIRTLCQLDKTIKSNPSCPDNIVSYRNVEVHQIKHAAGRSRNHRGTIETQKSIGE